MLDILIWEVRAAVRRLARSPAFVVAVVLSLAVGIGADVTMLGVVDALLFRPPAHVRDVDRVVDVRIRTFPDYMDLRDNSRAFSGVAAYAPRPYTIVDASGVTPAAGLMASATLFPVLGVRPAIGRFYTTSEDRPGGPHVAVLGYSLWQRRYGGARSAIGRSLRVAGDLYTIIGVAPQGFTGAGLAPVDLFLPISTTKFDAGREALTSRRYSWLHVVARLAPGVSAAQAQAEAMVIFERGNAADSAAVRPQPGQRDAEVRPLVRARRELAAANVPVSLWLAGVATVVLLIACANVAGLLLARGVRDRQTLAVRAALGAPRGRLAAALLLESAMLAAAGGAGGLLLSRWGGALIRTYLLTGVAAARAPLDARVLAITLVVIALTILACGVWPALRVARVDAARELAGGARMVSAPHARVRRVLLVAQLALALVLLVGAGLFTESLRNAHHVDLGMSLEHVLAVDIHMEGAGYTAARERALVPRILARLATIPGVRMAAVTDANVAPGWMSYSFSVPGRDSVPGRRPLPYPPGLSAVTPGFLATIGTPVLLGRGFVDADRSRRVIVINQRFARRYWPGENPLGRCVKVGDAKAPCAEVIGVSGNRRGGPADTVVAPEAFIPLGSPVEPAFFVAHFPGSVIAIRTAGDPERVAPAVQRAVQELLPDVPAVRVRPALELFDPIMRPWRLGATLFTTFGAVALVLALVGVYGVVAYGVARRAREIGIRMALGATPRDVMRLVLGDTARTAVVGAGAGVVIAVVVARAMATLLFGISPLSPAVYLAACLLLVGTALAAGVLPARRAARLAPTLALRSE